MPVKEKMILNFSASNINRGYKNKSFEFDCIDETAVFRVLNKFKDSGNEFHSIEITFTDQYNTKQVVYLDEDLKRDYQKLSYEAFRKKYDLDF